MKRTFLIIGRAIAIIVFAACLILVLWWVPKKQVASLWNAKGIEAKDVFKAENDARVTIAQIIGGFAGLVGLVFAWRNIGATAKNLELTNKNLELTKEGQVTERFTKAIEQLGATDNDGKPKLELRLGGIYALELIAQDSKKDHWSIMEVLITYVRKRTHNWPTNESLPTHDPLATDIQAILTVIGHRKWSYERSDQILDLHWADLRNANLIGAHLKNAILTHTYVEGASLMNAHLEAHLESAHLEGANLMNAHLEGAHLEGAHLEGNTSVEGTDLRDVQGVTQAQINSAIGDKTTVLPAGIVMLKSWKKKASKLT